MKPKTEAKRTFKEKITDLFDLAEMDLYDLHDRLWYEYFHPLKSHTAEAKAHIMKQLNVVGQAINEEAKAREQEVVLIDNKTKHTWDELGPNRREVIYCETRMPDPPKGHMATRAGKISAANPTKKTSGPVFTDEEDLLGEDEDLMGDTKPAKKSAAKKPRSTDPNKITATSIYPELAKLADKFGDSADKISKAKPEWPRKCITDALWKWRKTKG